MTIELNKRIETINKVHAMIDAAKSVKILCTFNQTAMYVALTKKEAKETIYKLVIAGEEIRAHNFGTALMIGEGETV